MKYKKMIVMVLIVLACLGILGVYNSPEENSKYENDLQGIMKAGSWYSWLLFIGNKGWLLREFDFTESAKSKLEKANIQEVISLDIMDKYRVGGGKYEDELRSILFAEPEDIELVAFERRQNYMAMTFIYNDQFDESPDIPDKGRMVYSVVFRYYEPHNDALWKKVLRKTANAVPFCSAFGTTGRWLVVDYSYTYNQADYATWYLREGDLFVNQKKKENMDYFDRLNTKEGRQDFMNRVDKEIAISDAWASAWVKRHPEHIDEQLFEAANRAQKETEATTQ